MGDAGRDSILENLQRNEVSVEVSAKTQSFYELLAKIVDSVSKYHMLKPT